MNGRRVQEGMGVNLSVNLDPAELPILDAKKPVGFVAELRTTFKFLEEAVTREVYDKALEAKFPNYIKESGLKPEVVNDQLVESLADDFSVLADAASSFERLKKKLRGIFALRRINPIQGKTGSVPLTIKYEYEIDPVTLWKSLPEALRNEVFGRRMIWTIRIKTLSDYADRKTVMAALAASVRPKPSVEVGGKTKK